MDDQDSSTSRSSSEPDAKEGTKSNEAGQGTSKKSQPVVGRLTARKGVAEKVGPAKADKRAASKKSKEDRKVSFADPDGAQGDDAAVGGGKEGNGDGEDKENRAENVAGEGGEKRVKQTEGRRKSSAKKLAMNNPFIAR